MINNTDIPEARHTQTLDVVIAQSRLYVLPSPMLYVGNIKVTWQGLLVAECLSARLLILQCVFSVGGVWCHASGMQLKVWVVRKYPFRLGMQLKHPVYKKLYTHT